MATLVIGLQVILRVSRYVRQLEVATATSDILVRAAFIIVSNAEVRRMALSLVLVAAVSTIIVPIVDVHDAFIVVVIGLTVKSDQTLACVRYLG